MSSCGSFGSACDIGSSSCGVIVCNRGYSGMAYGAPVSMTGGAAPRLHGHGRPFSASKHFGCTEGGAGRVAA